MNTFEGRSQFAAWVHKIAVRIALTELRRKRWRDSSLDELTENEDLPPPPGLLADPQAGRETSAGREVEIGRIYRHPWFGQAPLVIAICAISSQAWVSESDRFNARIIDAAIVADHLILAATNLRLGTCWIATFDVEAAGSVLGLPAEVKPVIFTPIGYPADMPAPKLRKPLDELVRYEHW